MARERQEQAKHAYDQKFAEAPEAEEAYHSVKTVTMRAGSLVTTEADFFQTQIEHQGALPLYTGLAASNHCQCASADW